MKGVVSRTAPIGFDRIAYLIAVGKSPNSNVSPTPVKLHEVNLVHSKSLQKKLAYEAMNERNRRRFDTSSYVGSDASTGSTLAGSSSASPASAWPAADEYEEPISAPAAAWPAADEYEEPISAPAAASRVSRKFPSVQSVDDAEPFQASSSQHGSSQTLNDHPTYKPKNPEDAKLTPKSALIQKSLTRRLYDVFRMKSGRGHSNSKTRKIVAKYQKDKGLINFVQSKLHHYDMTKDALTGFEETRPMTLVEYKSELSHMKPRSDGSLFYDAYGRLAAHGLGRLIAYEDVKALPVMKLCDHIASVNRAFEVLRPLYLEKMDRITQTQTMLKEIDAVLKEMKVNEKKALSVNGEAVEQAVNLAGSDHKMFWDLALPYFLNSETRLKSWKSFLEELSLTDSESPLLPPETLCFVATFMPKLVMLDCETSFFDRLILSAKEAQEYTGSMLLHNLSRALPQKKKFGDNPEPPKFDNVEVIMTMALMSVWISIYELESLYPVETLYQAVRTLNESSNPALVFQYVECILSNKPFVISATS